MLHCALLRCTKHLHCRYVRRVNDVKKDQMKQADEIDMLEGCNTVLQEQFQSKPTVASSTCSDHRRAPQFVTKMGEVTSEPLDVQTESTALNTLVVQTELIIEIQRDDGQAWKALHVDAPSRLTSKLSSSLLQSVVGDLTKFAWLDRGDPCMKHDSRILLMTIAELAKGVLPILENCSLKRYLAILSHIGRRVELQSRTQVKVLGLCRNKALVTDTNSLGLIDSVDIVRAARSSIRVGGTGEGDIIRTVTHLQAPSQARSDRDTDRSELR